MSRENVELVRRVFEVFQAGLRRGEPDAAFNTGLVAPDAEWYTPPGFPGPPVFQGREGWLDFLRLWTEDFEDWSIELERAVDAGSNRVVALFHHRAVGKGSGVPVEFRQGFIYELEAGRVIRMRNYLTFDEALEAAGLSE
jgi:ketosteroid isomerase-like protein